MSKTVSFRGKLAVGIQDRIKLSTNNGKTGYKITKFITMMTSPGSADYEALILMHSKKQTSPGSTVVDFTDGDLLAASYMEDGSNYIYPISTGPVIFDNEIINQDIYVSYGALTGTMEVNYYIELETMSLTDIQSTQLTLKALRNVASR